MKKRLRSRWEIHSSCNLVSFVTSVQKPLLLNPLVTLFCETGNRQLLGKFSPDNTVCTVWGTSLARVKVNHKIMNYRWKLCELCGYESKGIYFCFSFYTALQERLFYNSSTIRVQFYSVVLLDNLGLISDIYTLNFLNSFGHIPLDISYCREKENRPVLDLFFFFLGFSLYVTFCTRCLPSLLCIVSS